MKIDAAVQSLRDGGVIVYPTDTAYAIGCAFDDQAAIKRIMKLKGRVNQKFTIIASSLAQAQRYFPLNACQKKLARTYWPGPLSIVVSSQYAVRVPDNAIARSLARRIGKPIIATSFNKSGEPEVFNLNTYLNTTTGRALALLTDVIVNIGALPKRKPSTVIECKDTAHTNTTYSIHRYGSIRL